MEEKHYKVFLEKQNNNDYMVFKTNDESCEINLNSSNQSDLRKLFYKIIKDLFNFDVKISVDESVFKYQNILYSEIVSDYVNDLNSEIQKIKNSMPNLE